MTRPSASPPARGRLLALSTALVLLAPGAGWAAAPLPVETLAAKNGRLVVSVDLGAAVTPEVLRELGNGLSNVLAIYVSLAPAAGGEPIALYGRIAEVLYDVWEETYTVKIRDPRSPGGRVIVVQSEAGLRTLLASGRDLDLGPLPSLPAGGFVVQARVELNPVSKEQLARTREYIATAGPRSGGSRSVLGAMASALLREPPPDADVSFLRSRVYAPAEVAR